MPAPKTANGRLGGSALPVTSVIAHHGVRWYVVLFALLLIPVLVYWVEYTEIVANGPDLAAMSLPIAVFFVLITILPINVFVQKRKPLLALTQTELMVIYGVAATGVYIGGIGMMQFLTPTLVGWRHYATSENHWGYWFQYVRSWAVPSPSVVSAYYDGHSSFFTTTLFFGWFRAIVVWSCFLITALGCMYCVTGILRRQWVETERLQFPIIQVPLMVTSNGGANSLWSNPVLWGGCGVAAGVEILAFLHYTVWVVLPYIPIKPYDALNIGALLTTSPWNASGQFVTSFYPFVIGLCFLLPTDLSFSCWFFYLLTKAESVGTMACGYGEGGLGQPPMLPEQSVGAFVGLALAALWSARLHLRAVMVSVFGNSRSKLDDSDEPLSYKSAVYGFLISTVLLVGFGVAIGLSIVTSTLYFVLLLILALALSRIRAEAGLPWGQAPAYYSHLTIEEFGGTMNLSPQELTGFTFVQWFDHDWACLEQPLQFEMMKAASTSTPALNARKLTLYLFLAALVGLASSWVSCLSIYYHYGADSAVVNAWRTAQGKEPFEQPTQFLSVRTSPSYGRIEGAIFGVATTLLLTALRTKLAWWPFHPIGYAVAGTDTMPYIWMPLMIGWAAKSLILRYTGSKGYQRSLPFFIGLVLGDYAVSGLLAIFCVITGHPSYRTFPI